MCERHNSTMAAEAGADQRWILPLLSAALGLALGSFLSSAFSSILTRFSGPSSFSVLKVVSADHEKPVARQAPNKPSRAWVSTGKERKVEIQKKCLSDSRLCKSDAPLHSEDVFGDLSSGTPRSANDCDSENFQGNEDLKPDPYDTSKRQGYLSWDDYFMAIAFLSAHRSKDPNRQVGACVVSQDRVILGIGYNGFPRGCSDDELPWAKMALDGDSLQTKYPYVCHAEVNAILNKNQASACGQRLYVTMFPCNECAKVIIQAGVAEVVYFTDKSSTSNSYIASQKLLSMAGVKVWQHQPENRRLILHFK